MFAQGLTQARNTVATLPQSCHLRVMSQGRTGILRLWPSALWRFIHKLFLISIAYIGQLALWQRSIHMAGLPVLSKAANPFSSYQTWFPTSQRRPPGSEAVLMSSLARLEALIGTQSFQKGSLDSIPVLNLCFSISSSELQGLCSFHFLLPLQVQACLRPSHFDSSHPEALELKSTLCRVTLGKSIPISEHCL